MASLQTKSDARTAVLTAAGLAAAAFLVVRLQDVILMAFGAVLVAILLHAIAAPVRRVTRLPQTASLAAAVVIVAGCAAAIVWLFGNQAASQLSGLSDLLPGAWLKVRARLSAQPFGAKLVLEIEQLRTNAWLLGLGSRAVTSVSAWMVGCIIVGFAGLYLALNPRAYFQGGLSLIPPRARSGAERVLLACHVALQQWLVGQVASTLLVGATVMVGLWLAGCPSPVALGVIAGLAQFVPVIGPMAATVPGLLAALAGDPPTLVWTALTYLAAAQFEANVVTPLLLRQMVQVPMAITLFAVLTAGVLLGPLGVLFATPLTVVAFVLVTQLYLRPKDSPHAPG